MRQGWKALAMACALVACAGLAAPLATPTDALAASKSKGSSSSSKAKTYQFTGIVTDLDAKSLTVQKGKTKPTTRTFAKHEKMRVTGDLGKGAKVTVYYRNEGKDTVAHRVVVKDGKGSGKKR